MAKTNALSQHSRRHFLLALGAGTASTAAALVAMKPSTAQKTSATEQRPEGAGYTASAHINNYYRTAKI